MLKILQARLQQYVDRELPEVQAGFRRRRGTRDQIANICWIMEKAREFQKNIYFCFIDYAKAFDCVDHNKLWQVLKEMGVPDHLICLLRNLYAGQEATVRTGHGTTDWFKTEKGVWQGCILLPCLFNFYAEHIMGKAGLDESPVGIKIAGRNINNLRYADDTTLMAESEEELKSLLMRVKKENAKVGLKLNIKKTKIMASGPLTSWQIDGEEMEVVTDFIFLGSLHTGTAAKKFPGEESYGKSRQHTKKQRHHPANKSQILKMKLKYFDHLMRPEGLPGEEPNAGNNRWQKKKGTAENEKYKDLKTHIIGNWFLKFENEYYAILWMGSLAVLKLLLKGLVISKTVWLLSVYSSMEAGDICGNIQLQKSQLFEKENKSFVDARVQPIYGGTNEIMKELIARDIVSDNEYKRFCAGSWGELAYIRGGGGLLGPARLLEDRRAGKRVRRLLTEDGAGEQGVGGDVFTLALEKLTRVREEREGREGNDRAELAGKSGLRRGGGGGLLPVKAPLRELKRDGWFPGRRRSSPPLVARAPKCKRPHWDNRLL
ncbi:Retrovirus-related Pol polyprotein from type-2 retrotransposable element R2DM [Varanus komodoensis]|nr:Retrovirus-related Pol polyprotein from type-2 retrotransposable element R2DM [Varanus komodoensis]